MILIFHCKFGLVVYPELKEKREKALVAKKRVIDIKNAYYKYNNSSKLLNGSLDNFSQSRSLSNSISALSTLEQNYNSSLIKTKTYKEDAILYWFSYGWIISDKVNNMKRISIDRLDYKE